MPVLFRVSNQGALGAGDVFSHGCYVRAADGTTIAAMASAGVTALNAMLSGAVPLRTQYHSSTVWQEVLTEEVDEATGDIIDSVPSVVSVAGNAVTASPLPGQCAVVITLRTATVARTGRGRFYLPGPGVQAVDATGKLSAASQAAYVSALGQYFASIDGSGLAASVVVYSTKLRTYQPISAADVGNVFDTQTRRRNKVAESRSGIAV